MTDTTEQMLPTQGPDELFLQLHGDDCPDDCTEPVDYTDGVTWCWHKIHDSDVRYIRADLAATARAVPMGLLTAKHVGMKVDYRGLLRQAREGLRREPAIAEMLRQFQDHMTELGHRWYTSDTAVVDEILQLYCIETDARAMIAAAPPVGIKGGE